MARLIAMTALLRLLAACASVTPAPPWNESPDFNDCWNMFPPGPEFQKQIEDYMGTTDRNATVLGCVPQYRLDEVTCRRFEEVGPGDWPQPVIQWCGKYFGVTLKTAVRNLLEDSQAKAE